MVAENIWDCSELYVLLRKCSPFAPNTFVLGPHGLDSIIEFLMEYQSYISLPVLCTGLDVRTRLDECERLESCLKAIHCRLVELIGGLTIKRQRYQIDPPGFRDAEHAYSTMRLSLPVSQANMPSIKPKLLTYSFTFRFNPLLKSFLYISSSS